MNKSSAEEETKEEMERKKRKREERKKKERGKRRKSFRPGNQKQQSDKKEWESAGKTSEWLMFLFHLLLVPFLV